MRVKEICARQRDYFFSGATRSISFRRDALKKLLGAIQARESELFDALTNDLGKAPMESYLTEISVVTQEIRYALAHLARWSRPVRVPTPLVHFPAKSRIYHDPLGVVLILAPWNYPFQLAVAPLVAAIAAGNCAVVKSSRMSPAVGKKIAEMIADIFPPEYVACVDSALDSNDDILAERYDHILFTGSEAVGKSVMAAAARNLTPVTLELGGKSPCIVDETADIELSAKRIVWGKFLNAGQTCVAPDFILVHRSVKGALIEALKKSVAALYSETPLASRDLAKIVNVRHWERLVQLLPGPSEREIIVFGGEVDRENRRIAPTILDQVTFDSPVMREEIFGPILPILEYDSLDETLETLQKRPTPLALYLFTKNRAMERRVFETLRFGGGCVNDTVVHLSNHHLPFGGVGPSGMGAYHGRTGFETLSHRKSVLHKGLWFDVPLRYPPYLAKIFRLVRLILR